MQGPHCGMCITAWGSTHRMHEMQFRQAQAWAASTWLVVRVSMSLIPYRVAKQCARNSRSVPVASAHQSLVWATDGVSNTPVLLPYVFGNRFYAMVSDRCYRVTHSQKACAVATQAQLVLPIFGLFNSPKLSLDCNCDSRSQADTLLLLTLSALVVAVRSWAVHPGTSSP